MSFFSKKDDGNTIKTSPSRSENQYSVAGRIARVFVAVIMCGALVITGLSTALISFDSGKQDDLVIVLDPGHGGADTGAINKRLGLSESAINLKIALACRERLNQYKGVSVYLTHTGVNNLWGKSSLSRRVSVAGEVGADIFISLHINSASNKTANGIEVFVPTTKHEPKYNKQCTALGESIISKVTSLGLNSRGIKTRKSGGGRIYKFSDGTTEVGDYYYVVGEPISRLGIPGILVEHAFIESDSDYLDSDEDLAALGRADADGIAAFYGLKLRENAAASSSAASSSIPEPPASSEDLTSEDDYTSEEEAESEVKVLEDMIRNLPDNPTAYDANQIRAVREGYIALSASERASLDPELYQKMYRVVTAYEEAIRQVRIVVRDGSQLAIDRFDGKLLNAVTTAQLSGKVTVLSVMVELELYINPNAPEQYKNEGVLTYRVTSPDGRELEENDEIPEGSVIAVTYNDTMLDSLVISLQ